MKTVDSRLPAAPRPAGVVRPWWRPAWHELLPEVVLAFGLGWFLIDEPDAATSAFKSGRAVLLMAVTALVWVVGRAALARLVPWGAVRTALFGLAAVGALAVVVLPAYDNATVVEAFPSSPSPGGAAPDSATPVTAAAPVTARPSSDVGQRPTAGTVPPTRTVEAASAAAPPATVTAPPATVPAEPVRLRTAAFMGIDHRASGTVSVYRAPDGRHVIGLESFDIQPGPDYDVYVVPGLDRDGTDGGTRLDDLRGNQGTQYYDVPAEVDVATGEWTVLIWCQTFGVPVANATPA